MKITSKNLLKYLLITIFITISLSFAIKYAGLNDLLPWNIAYSDLTGYAATPSGKNVFAQGMPYIDYPREYPVIMGMTMYLTSRNGTNTYLFLNYLIFLAASIITTIYLCRLTKNKLNLFIFWALAPSFIWFVYFNWDIIAVMFTVLAIYFYKEKKDISATIFISLGFATKIYPILILLPILANKKLRDWIKISSTFIITTAIINLFFIIKNPQMWFASYLFHGVREPNLDSIWGVLQNIFPFISTGAINIITLLLFAAAYFYINIKFRKKDFIILSFISILLFLLINKVFSPQYLLWLLPFFAIFGEKIKIFYILELSNLIILPLTLTHIFSGQDLTFFLIFSGIFVLIRHLALFSVLIRKLALINKPQ